MLISHAIEIPPEIRHLSASFRLSLPDRAGIRRLIREEAEGWQRRHGRKIQLNRQAIEQLTNHLLGVTDARRLIRTAIQDDGAITQSDLPEVMQAKYALLGHQGAISFEYDTERFSEVAGLSHFKQWLEQRRKSFTGNAASLQRPKGVMLLGVHGGGKSLAAKAVAGSFSLPLLRVDFGALYDKYIGESEKNLRQALRIAETMAPCVLWMDEIFFVDLPTTGVRREIFAIHLRRRNQAPSGFDLEALAEASEGFTGAEIEQAIVASLYAANAAGERMESEHLLEELTRTSPLSVVMAEEMGALRAWAEGRTVPAG
ncbi:MAG: AAA family ATPase [Candidatus Sedimenticola endophacoides]